MLLSKQVNYHFAGVMQEDVAQVSSRFTFYSIDVYTLGQPHPSNYKECLAFIHTRLFILQTDSSRARGKISNPPCLCCQRHHEGMQMNYLQSSETVRGCLPITLRSLATSSRSPESVNKVYDSTTETLLMPRSNICEHTNGSQRVILDRVLLL